MIFQDIFEACDCVASRDLIRIDTYLYLDKDVVKFDNYHKLTLTSHIEVIYNAVNTPFGYSYAVQEALVTKNFERFNRLVNECWVRFDYNGQEAWVSIKKLDKAD